MLMRKSYVVIVSFLVLSALFSILSSVGPCEDARVRPCDPGIPEKPTTTLPSGILAPPIKNAGMFLVNLFEDDVEGGDLGYTPGESGGTSPTPWARRDTYAAHSGSWLYDFGDGNYNDPDPGGGLSWLISPDIPIPTTVISAELCFWHWRDFEYSSSTCWDGGNVKVSTTGAGGPWSLITPDNGYDGTIASGYENPLVGEQAFGSAAGWEEDTWDLTAYIGQTINIRWDAGVDNYASTDQGWRIDDIVVRGNTNQTNYSIPLSTGWNLVSLPLVQNDTAISTVLDSISGQWDYAIWYDAYDDADHWKSYATFKPPALNQLQDADHTMGLWLSVTGPCTLNVEGEIPENTTINLRAGWNLVGYPCLVDQPAVDTLPSEVDMVALADEMEPYLIRDVYDISTVTLRTGEGYWLRSTADVIWTVENPQPDPIRQTAEFERMQGVLIRYPLGITFELIAEMAENDTVYTIVEDITTMDEAYSFYQSNGVNMTNCEWVFADS
ncbi:MAG: hypothetical protein KAX31_06510, partial [Thermoplasmata archaeon]|nr:hypothetical protein [Thermoplasmata archaeon]